MAQQRGKITFYVDIVSPFAYIAFYILKNSSVFKQVDINYVPIVLGGLMKTCGNTPPLQIKNKDKWIDAERNRWSAHFNIPIAQSPPPGFPLNTLPLQRALTVISLSYPHKLEPAISLFWDNFWVKYNEPMQPENLRRLLETLLESEEEAGKVLERMTTEEIKGKLRENTQDAFEDGAFGLPWFAATNAEGEKEGYWGVDHMGQLCDHLGLERPSGKGWRSLL